MRSFVLTGLLAAWPALLGAQNLPDIGFVLAEIDGREVAVDGHLSNHDIPGAWFLRTGEFSYSIDLAVDRGTRRAIDECPKTPGGRLDCPIKALAEIRIHENTVRLIVYDLQFLDVSSASQGAASPSLADLLQGK